jgi:hypothetical protein
MKKVLELVQTKKEFDNAGEELYAKISDLVYNKLDITIAESISVLAYLQHQLMHSLLDAQDDEDS